MILFLLACQNSTQPTTQQYVVDTDMHQLQETLHSLEESAFALESQIDILRRAKSAENQEIELKELQQRWNTLQDQHQQLKGQMNELREHLTVSQPSANGSPNSQNESP